MLADGFAKHFHHKILETVDDFRLVGEPRRLVHHAEHLYDALHFVQISEIGFGIGKKI